MARPIDESLSYFPTDVGIFDDEKLLFTADKFGDFSDLVAIKLLAWIYKKGYYCKWSKAHLLLFTRESFRDTNSDKVEEIVHELIAQDFFSKEIYDRFEILTSIGIQKRWTFIIKNSKRKARINNLYSLLNSEETQGNEELTPAITDGSTQSKVKKSKVKEIKELSFLPEETKGKMELFFSNYTKISSPDYDTFLKPLEKFYLQIPECMNDMHIDECFTKVFERIKENGGSVNMEYLIENIQGKITAKHEQILKDFKKKELDEAKISRSDAEKQQKDHDEETKRKLIVRYKGFYENNPEKFTIKEKTQLIDAFKNAKWLILSSIIEPKMEEAELV